MQDTVLHRILLTSLLSIPSFSQAVPVGCGTPDDRTSITSSADIDCAVNDEKAIDSTADNATVVNVQATGTGAGQLGGNIALTGASSIGISLSGVGSTAINNGSITASDSYGLYASNTAENAVLKNNGFITGTNDTYSIYSDAPNVTIINTGTISNDNVGRGIYTDTNSVNANITNSGTINITISPYATGVAAGIYNRATGSSTISNSGYINGYYSYGIYNSVGSTNSVIHNSGVITAFGDTYAIAVAGVGVHIANTGSISGDSSVGVYVYEGGDNPNIENFGFISLTGNSYGIYNDGSNARILNSGSIIGDGTENSTGITNDVDSVNTVVTNTGTIRGSQYGVWSGSNYTVINTGVVSSSFESILIDNGSTLINSGVIENTVLSNSAIHAGETGSNTAILNPGSVVIGSIDSDGSNNTLQLNLGSAKSYAYETTGQWIVQDLDNRPMVRGSAIAAGIGAQETAGEVLYERLSKITASIPESEEKGVRPYYNHRSRNNRDQNVLINGFDHYSYGVSVDLPLQIKNLDTFLNIENAHLNIDSGSQRIHNNSLALGLYKIDVRGGVGYTQHKGHRELLTNTVSTGISQSKSSYSSFWGFGGLQREADVPQLEGVKVKGGVEMSAEYYPEYSESLYFSWDRRFLSQVSGHAGIRADRQLWNEKTQVLGQINTAARLLLLGQSAHYRIKDIAVNFRCPKNADLYADVGLGIEHRFKKGFLFKSSGNFGKSLSGVYHQTYQMSMTSLF